MEFNMACNCKNKSNVPEEPEPKKEQLASEPMSESNEQQNDNIQFRKTDPEPPKQSKLTMMQSFASAITSRGFNNEKVTKPIKQLRVISCFGNQAQGGILPPCEHLKESSTAGKFYCGGCGCGDRKGTWLLADGDEYSKLDYPRLTCPLQMPGFSNYEKSKPDESEIPITRRYYIEQLSYADVDKIPVKTFEMPEEMKKQIEEFKKQQEELRLKEANKNKEEQPSKQE